MSIPDPGQTSTQPLDVPLCVDLDGTLLRTDLLQESILRLVRRDPRSIFLLLLWALRGRAVLKAEVANRVVLPVGTLPVCAPFLDRLRSEKAAGRRLVLCTAAWRSQAQAVASHFGIFDEVIATDGRENLSGENKARRLAARFGARGFDYAGDSRRDLPVWHSARTAIDVGTPQRAGSGRRLMTWLRALRPHQWSKNVLVFVPAMASHSLPDQWLLLQLAVAFASFSIAASGNYLLNDLLDLDADRLHASKRHRALAAGELRIAQGVILAVVLLAGALVLGTYVLGPEFLGILLAYLAVSLWYSLALKRQPMVDIMCLAALYTLRIIGGSVATSIEPSFWLLAFSMFLFLSLAAAKRVTELKALQTEGATTAAGRGYGVADLPLMVAFGVAAGYVSVLVIALYVESAAEALYSEPRLLWLVCPVLLYWISRIWLRTYRGTLHDDPVVFALSDRPSILAGLLCGLLILLAV